ncbi:kinesin-like protein KIF19 [Planococcus citri]|uniref:kinesin-like protein KIF19 n=1 Tax=Planococcus citri TaxID=170843 RepID=UPI0031FA15AB
MSRSNTKGDTSSATSTSAEYLSSSSNGIADSKRERIAVVVRIRPIFKKDQNRSVFAIDNKTIILEDNGTNQAENIYGKRKTSNNSTKKQQFVFDAVFAEDTSQEEMYNFTTKYLISEIISGYNGTIMAYGATGSGKTYTLMSTNNLENSDKMNFPQCGIIIQAFRDLFDTIHQQSHQYVVSLSYLEIYNESIKDLFNCESGNLELRGSGNNVQIMGLTELEVDSTQQAVNLLLKGNENRSVRSTAANSGSSRSHAILIIILRQTFPREKFNGFKTSVRQSKLLFVDLAGSERARHTKNRGKKLQEGSHINKSLLALSNCITALSNGTDVANVNFRDSKLTRLLREPLSGNYRTIMIAQINPDVEFRDETKNTLIYAFKAMGITKNVNKNVASVALEATRYQTLINELRNEIARLKLKIHEHHEDDEPINESNTVQKFREEIVAVFEKEMKLRKKLIDIDSQILYLNTEMERHHQVLSYWQSKNKKLYRFKNSTSSENSENNEDDDEATTHIDQAWVKLNAIEEDLERYSKEKTQIMEELEDVKTTTKNLENNMIFTSDAKTEKEILTLLCRVYELEADKLVLQGDRILDTHELHRISELLKKYRHQQKITDNIITKQRQLIEEKRLPMPSDLKNLYQLYQQEIHETTLRNFKEFDNGKVYHLPTVPKAIKESRPNNHLSETYLPKVDAVMETSRRNSLRLSPIPVTVLFPPITF